MKSEQYRHAQDASWTLAARLGQLDRMLVETRLYEAEELRIIAAEVAKLAEALESRIGDMIYEWEMAS